MLSLNFKSLQNELMMKMILKWKSWIRTKNFSYMIKSDPEKGKENAIV